MRSDYAQAYAQLHRQHWWWRVRQDLILDQVRGLNLADDARLMDVGCGSGLLLPALAAFGQVHGLEVDTSLLTDRTPFRQRIHTQPLGHSVYRGMSFDLITALDVLEHIRDDDQAVTDIFAMLKPGGHLLVTVPAMMSLWDQHDRINHHQRRYTARGLRRLLAPHGTVHELRYLFHSLYLPKLAVRGVNSLRRQKIAQHRIPAPWINQAMEQLCRLEHRLLTPLRLPFGTSLLALVRKPLSAAQVHSRRAAA